MAFKGNVDREDYIDFANYVFGFNGADRSFEKLLPKLFKEGTNTAEDTFFVKEGDRLAACVGSFPIEFSILAKNSRFAASATWPSIPVTAPRAI